jgi:hypothetical protein
VYGILTRSAETAEWDDVDRVVFEAKDATGRSRDPIPNAVNALTCFADAAAIEGEDVVAVDREGQPARQDPTEAPGEADAGAWNYVCPTHPDYQDGLLAAIEAAADVSPDVRLDEVGFPNDAFCHCERCDRRFAGSEHADRAAWREAAVSDFLERVRERVPGELSLSLHPDPYPGHLAERSGIDLDALAPLLDEVVVPLYDAHYTTTHWLETLASGFADCLAATDGFDGRLGVELFADVDVAALSRATDAVEPHADVVYFGYDEGTARALLRRRRAEAASEGATTHRPE